MTFQKICRLADYLTIKIAEHQYQDQPPENVKASDIDWVDPETQQTIRDNGKNDKYLPHNPPGAIADEKIWDRAKKVVKKYWKKYEEPWAVVYDVYRKMGGKPKKKKKSNKN